MGESDAGRLRIRRQAIPEVHAPDDVPGPRGEADRRDDRGRRSQRRPSRRDRRARASQRRGSRRVSAWHRSAGILGQARRLARAVSTQLQGHTRIAGLPDGPAPTPRQLSGRGRTPAPELERSRRRHGRPPERLHGRNAAQWWRHDKSEDRYDYLYSNDELKEFSETADAARRLVKKLYLYTNNHFSAKSVANAAMIKQQLGEPIAGTYPPEFVARYPELAGVVDVSAPTFVRRQSAGTARE